MSSLKGYEKCSVDLGHFRLKLGMVFFTLVLKLVSFLRRSYFFIINNKASSYSHLQYL